LILDLRVQPGAPRCEFAGRHGERIKVRLAARAVDGKANEARVSCGSLRLRACASRPSRRKRVVIGALKQCKPTP